MSWSGRFAGLRADWDVLLLLSLILADIRVFQGSTVASFTLYELFAWGYCAPVVVGHLLGSRTMLMPASSRFVGTVARYLAWILLASIFALFGRGHSDVLQEAKNILPTLPMVCFLLIRIRRPATVSRLADLYVLYCVAACVLALMQIAYGGPYLRPELENNEYKLDFSGNLISNLALGFSTTPNELALAVLPGVMFAAMRLVHEIREGRFPRLLTLACCTATGGVFVLAQSRGAVACFIFAFIFMAGPMRRTQSFGLKVALTAGLVALLVGYGMSVAPGGATGVENTVESRALLWQTSFEAMANDPYVALFGDGIGFMKQWSWKIAGWEFPDAHNGWLDQAVFFGLPAIVFYLAIWRRFFAITDAATISGRIAPPVSPLLDSIRASVLAFMGLYFFEPVAHSVMPVSQLFLLMSCGVALSYLPAGQRARDFRTQ